MIIQLRSMAETVRVRKALAAKGIASRIVQTPRHMQRGGCGYALHLPQEALGEAENAAQKTGCRILGVMRSDGG